MDPISTRLSRHQRGYGSKWDVIRERVLSVTKACVSYVCVPVWRVRRNR